MCCVPCVLLVTMVVPHASLCTQPGQRDSRHFSRVEAINRDVAVGIVHARHQLCKRMYRILYIAHIYVTRLTQHS